MSDSQKVILRFADGKMLKGIITDLKLGEDALFIEDESSSQLKVRLKELKAIFFVRRFEGNPEHQEKKSFTGSRPGSRRVFIKFKDGESMMGFVEGDLPWRTGFFLESMKDKGFYIVPVDEASNNIKIFVVTSAVRDVATIGV
jgi:Family of unknown function (DUF6982)